MKNEVERLYDELISVGEIISKSNSPSDSAVFETIASKSMILAAASYFEKVVCDLIINHARNTLNTPTIASFIENQALNRKYHTLFSWKESNINHFVNLFGTDFSEYTRSRLNKESIKNAAKEFLFLGQTRNDLVHKNFSDYPILMTFIDIKTKFDKALPLVAFLSECLSKFEFEKSRGSDPQD